MQRTLKKDWEQMLTFVKENYLQLSVSKMALTLRVGDYKIYRIANILQIKLPGNHSGLTPEQFMERYQWIDQHKGDITLLEIAQHFKIEYAHAFQFCNKNNLAYKKGSGRYVKPRSEIIKDSAEFFHHAKGGWMI